MSTRGESAGTIRDLGLPGRAVLALTRAGVTTVEELAALNRRQLAAVEGLGPSSIAAIRAVVPEPGRASAGSTPPPDADVESPDAPPIPSFESLRDPRRRTPVDLLVPGPSPSPTPSAAAPGATAPRPAEYADLWRFGLRIVRAAAGVPVRVAWWSVRLPVRTVHRLLGEQTER